MDWLGARIVSLERLRNRSTPARFQTVAVPSRMIWWLTPRHTYHIAGIVHQINVTHLNSHSCRRSFSTLRRVMVGKGSTVVSERGKIQEIRLGRSQAALTWPLTATTWTTPIIVQRQKRVTARSATVSFETRRTSSNTSPQGSTRKRLITAAHATRNFFPSLHSHRIWKDLWPAARVSPHG